MLFQKLLGSVATSNASIGYITGVTDSASKTTYTFSSVSIGVAASDRLVVVCANPNGTSVTSISSMKIGGITASLAVQTQTNNGVSAIWFAVVPTGTTGTIEVVCNAAASRCRIDVYRVVGASNTTSPYNSSSSASDAVLSRSVGVQTIAGCVVVSASAVEGGSGTTWSSGVTENSDVTAGVPTRTFAVASADVSSGGTLNITATASAGATRNMALTAASFA